ncbi:DUF2207 domain-containing protein [uncultured Lactobacillus sp.]|uniref:DUF2207 domain-containing protein n=1 Tax=uncultured Lactobacillus sp. TaxID=153152 RepID=UPI0028038BE5|nr:DUF2207 domain-containing protein [uncultured Lactobacillus sp.]
MKRKYLSLIILSLFSFLAIFTHQVNADVDYSISNINVVAKVNRDGSLSMHRKIYYDFDSDAHGLLYRQNLNKNQKLSNVQVKVNDKKVALKNSQQNNTYQLTHKGASYRFKVFHNINEDDNVKIEYSYKILNAITNYKDTAELNFKIIGNGWDTDTDNAKVTVLFPGKVPDLKAWAHGPLNGQTEVLPKQGKIIMKASDVPGDVGIEVHSIFDPAVTSKNTNIVNKNKKKAIEKQEAQLAIEANKKRQRRVYLNWGLLIVSLISGAIILIKEILIKPKGAKPKKMRDLVHNYEIPDVSPVAAQILDENDKPNAKAFTAYIMQLAGKHKIKIEEYRTKRLKKIRYRITLVDQSILKDDLLEFLFNKVGDGESFTTQELKNYTSKKLGKKFDKWSKKHYKDVENTFFDKAVKKYKSNNLGVAILLIGISIISGIFAFFLSESMPQIFITLMLITFVIIILAIIATIIGNRRLSIYTTQGALETDKVRGFEKMLDDIGNFKMKDVGDIILWEDILPYAVAFGLSKKVIKQLKIEFNTDELNDSVFVYAPFYVNDHDSFERSFERSFTSGISTVSSISGGSGGFSGGSSGGFGGGSGGGAF